MVKRVSASEKDKEKLAAVNYDPMKDLVDEPDYTAVLIKKPWGYEYLLFMNKNVAVWVLHLDHGAQTSLHCHPNKKTSLMVLSGEVVFSTLSESIVVRLGEGLLVDKAVFHSTRAVSPEGAVVMETETPIYKRDLVRLNDSYGRERQGYEGKTYHVALDDSEYPRNQMFHKPTERYNVEKSVGACTLIIVKCTTESELRHILATMEADLVVVLKGVIMNAKSPFLEYGDIATMGDLRAKEIVGLTDPVELLLIKNITNQS